MPRSSTRRRSEIVDTINAALEIVDDVAEEGDGELVRAVVAVFALKEISEGNYRDDREDEDEDAVAEEDEEPIAEEDEEQDLDDEEEEDGGEEDEPDDEEEEGGKTAAAEAQSRA